MVVAPAPDRPVDGGMPTEALVAHVVVSKFADSLPLYRQAQMLERQGIKLDRSTLANWVGRACWWLTPLYELMLGTVLGSSKVFADDTTLPVLDPGRGRTKTGRLWCYAVDDRPWKGPGHPMAAYVYSDDRKNERPAGHLAGFRGVLQVDGYSGFKALAGARTDASVTLAFCWSHMRRHFYDQFMSDKSPLAAEVLARVRALYAIEAEIRGHPAEHRRAVRQERSQPIVEALHTWLHDQVGRVSGASDLARAMRYAIRHWPGLVVFLDDGRVEMDTNVVERAIRPHTLTRKNALFAGSDGGAKHWALALTLIQTAKLNGVDPMAWLTDVLGGSCPAEPKRTNCIRCCRETGAHPVRSNWPRPLDRPPRNRRAPRGKAERGAADPGSNYTRTPDVALPADRRQGSSPVRGDVDHLHG